MLLRVVVFVLAFMTGSSVMASLQLGSADLTAIADEIKVHKEIVEQLEKLAITLSSANFTSSPITQMCFESVEDQARKLGQLHANLDSKRRETFYLLHTALKDSQLPENPKLIEVLGEKRFRHFIGIENEVGSLFETARVFYLDKSDLELAYDLFLEAWAVYNETKRFELPYSSYAETTLVDHIQSTLSKMNRTKEAFDLCQRALDELDLTDDFVAHFKNAASIYRTIVAINQISEVIKDVNESAPMDVQIKQAEKLVNTSAYTICHQDSVADSRRKLAANPTTFCRLNDRNRHPLLVLAPVKEEIFRLEAPMVIFFHDIATSREIEQMKAAAEDEIRPAGVIQTETGQTAQQIATRRASTAWLDTDSFQSLANRIAAYTGMNPYEAEDDASEMMQIGHYGIGGHYVPHVDILAEASGENGDRIATLLLYMSNVERGGETAFLELNFTATPEANGALFWFNFLKNETQDKRTLHAACPVIKGEKWVANKWFRFRGQMLNKPCGLQPEDGFTLEDFNLRPIRVKTDRFLLTGSSDALDEDAEAATSGSDE